MTVEITYRWPAPMFRCIDHIVTAIPEWLIGYANRHHNDDDEVAR